MKKSIIALAGIAAAAMCSAAESPSGPRIACDEPTYDFGQRDNREVVEHTFVIRNEGDLTLEIKRVHASCGCTVVQTSSRSVPPGGTAEITARLNLHGRRGPQHKTITVESNDPQQPRLILSLKGIAAEEMNVLPDRFFFGQVTGADTVSRTVTVSSEAVSFNITNITCNSGSLSVSVETVRTGHSYRVTATLKPPLPDGRLSANVRLYTDSEKYPTIDLPVWARVSGALTVAPRELVIPAQGPALTRYLIVRATDGREFRIEAVEVPWPEIQISTNSYPGGGYRITLSNIQPSADLRDTAVVVRTDAEGARELRVPIRVLSL